MDDKIHTRHLREHEIEQDEIGPKRSQGFQAVFTVVGRFRLITFNREFIPVNVRNDMIVFDDEDFFHE